MKSLEKLFRLLSFRTASDYAAAAGYYMLLSFIPAAMFLLSLLSALPIQLGTGPALLLEWVRSVTPAASAVPIGSFGALFWIWSASKGIQAVTDGMDAVFGQFYPGSYLKRRFRSVLRFLLLSCGLIALFAVIGPGLQITASGMDPNAAAGILRRYRQPVSFLLLALLISMVYLTHPGSPLPLGSCLLGGCFSSFIWLMISRIFSVFVVRLSSTYQLYGVLGSLILIAVWLRYCILTLLITAKAGRLLSHRSQNVSE